MIQWKNSQPELAENREKWNPEVNTIKYGSIGDVSIISIALSSKLSDVVGSGPRAGGRTRAVPKPLGGLV